MAIAPKGTDTIGPLDFALTYLAGGSGQKPDGKPTGRQNDPEKEVIGRWAENPIKQLDWTISLSGHVAR